MGHGLSSPHAVWCNQGATDRTSRLVFCASFAFASTAARMLLERVTRMTDSGGSAVADDVATGRWVLAAAVLGSSLTFIDGTVVNVALPVLRRELGASSVQAQWVVESYMLFLASLILAGGAL